MKVLMALIRIISGDEIYIAPGVGLTVTTLKPERLLIMFTGDNRAAEAFSWVYVLNKLNDRTTRLIIRYRIIPQNMGLIASVLYNAVFDPGSFLQERKHILGIKYRAERVAGES